MMHGVSIYESYDGPPIDATEFCLYSGNINTRKTILDSLYGRFKSISAHLPSFLPSSQIAQEVAFDDGRIDYFVAHVTKYTPFAEWKKYLEPGKRILFENHNQDWHPTDAGWCRASDFSPIVDAGHEICLDLGHILYSCYSRGNIGESEQIFQEFLQLPIASVHVHTMDSTMDHSLTGYDIGPWVRAIETKWPKAILLVEVMDPKYSVEDKIQALSAWSTISG
jgi:hypothetical protein